MSLTEYRCPKCGKLLAKAEAPAGRIQVFCRMCGAVRAFDLVERPRLTAVRA